MQTAPVFVRKLYIFTLLWLSDYISPPEYATSFTRAWLRTAVAAELAYQEL